MRRWLWVLMTAGCVDANAPVHPGDDTPLSFEVPAGSSASALTDRLATQGVIPSTWKWKLYLRQADASCVKAGKHNLARSMSMAQVLEALCAPPVPDDEPFTVIEGWRILEIDAALAAKWKKAGYERVCCLRCVSTRDTNFGTACKCRVPRAQLGAGETVECANCGCRGCASGDGERGVAGAGGGGAGWPAGGLANRGAVLRQRRPSKRSCTSTRQ
jgi:hypothetical protein